MKIFPVVLCVLCCVHTILSEDSENENIFVRALKKIRFRKWKARMLSEHNRFRATTSPSAANMMKLQWNRSLYQMAQKWTDKCVFQHSPSEYRKSNKKFKYLGENLFKGSGTLENVVNAWAKEVQYYDYKKHKCSKVCGHYTQVVWAKTTHIGCAFTDCSKDKTKNMFIVSCLYGKGGNYKGVRPYLKGPRCSQCPEGTTCSDNTFCVKQRKSGRYFDDSEELDNNERELDDDIDPFVEDIISLIDEGEISAKDIDLI